MKNIRLLLILAITAGCSLAPTQSYSMSYATAAANRFTAWLSAKEPQATRAPQKPIKGDVFIAGDLLYPADRKADNPRGHSRRRIERALGRRIESNEPLVDVWATSKDDEHEIRFDGISARKGCGIQFPDNAVGWQMKADFYLTPEEDRGYMRSIAKNYWRNNDEEARRRGKSDNWSAHGHPEFDGKSFPSHLPLSLLIRKREGDFIDLTIHGKPVRLRCNQNGSRYNHRRESCKPGFEGQLDKQVNRFSKHPNYHGDERTVGYLVSKGILEFTNGKSQHGPNGFKEEDDSETLD